MGQCVGKDHEPGDPPLRLPSVSARNEATAYHLRRSTAGPLSSDDAAVEEVLGPLLQLVSEARFGYLVCQHVFKSMSRVARRGMSERPDGASLDAKLARIREVAWGVEELLASFSSRGWLLRLLRTSRLDALVRWRLDDIAALAEELASLRGASGGGDQDGTGADFVPSDEDSKQLAAGLRSVRRLREALSTHIPSVMAPYGAAGDPAAMDAFLRRITPLVQGGEDPLRQLELQEETQIAVAAMSVGPHRALRHPDLQLFWWRHLAGLEEVPWSTLWPHLATFLANTPRLSEGAGDIRAALAVLQNPERVRLLQSAVHRMGYANYVNAVELDMAFSALTSGGASATLDEQLRALTAPGRPILMARTSKGARADGWARDAEAAAAAAAAAERQAEVRTAGMARPTGVAATAPVGAGAMPKSSRGEDDGEEWYDAGSNFSRESSNYLSIAAASEEWPGGRKSDSRFASPSKLRASKSLRTSRESMLASADGRLARSSQDAPGTCAQGASVVAKLVNPPPTNISPQPSASPDKEALAKATRGQGALGVEASADQALALIESQMASERNQDTLLAAISAGGTDASARQRQEAEGMVPKGVTGAADPSLAPDGSVPEALHPLAGTSANRPARSATLTGLARLVGRDDNISQLVSTVLSSTDSRAVAAAALGGAGFVPAMQPQPALPPAPAIVLTGPAGCGKTALVTAAADRLAACGAWSGVALADLRCAAGPEEAALLIALALNVPFYAADRPGGARLLSWLRTHGPQLQQGLILDNVDLLLGAGRDDALELARGPSASGGRYGSAGGASQASVQTSSHAGAGETISTVEDRRRRALRLLRDITVAAPGLRLVLVAGPGVNWDLLQPAMPHGLSFSFQSLGGLALQDATQLLRNTLAGRGEGSGTDGGATGTLREEQLMQIAEACDRLPGLLRMAGAGVRCGAVDLSMMATAAAEALRRAYEMGTPEAGPSAFAAHLISHSITRLPAQARTVLCCMASVGVPLEEEDVAAVVGLGHPGVVRAGLCCLYDRGLLSYQDLSQRHEVVGHVSAWMLRYSPALLAPVVHGGSFTSTAAVAAAIASGKASHGSRRSGGGSRPVRPRAASTPGGIPDQTPATTPESSQLSRMPIGSSGSHKETGVRLRALVEHLDGLMGQAGELYASGSRVSALRFYNNGRILADRGLMLLPAWLRQAGPSTATAAVFAAVMTRHLNGICRHVLLPGQLARAARELAALLPSLPSPHDRLTGHVAAARTLAHLLSLRAAARQLAAADSLARQLYPALSGAVQAAEAQAQTYPEQAPQPPPPGEHRRTRGSAGGSGSELAGLPAQVVLLALAHAEVAAAGRRYNAAAHHLCSFLDLLGAVGLAGSLEGAQARMQLGDLLLRLGRPSVEAAVQYDAAASILTQLYGQSHFRVGRAMLAAARCSAEAAANAVISPARSLASKGAAPSGAASPATSDGPHSSGQRPLDIMLKDCLYVQQLSQGKFNLDVAEVEVARGSLLCQRNRHEEALSCGLVALGIVLEVLGDGTPQVAECLDLVAAALRQQRKSGAAAAISLHAQALRSQLSAAATAGGDDGVRGSTASLKPRLPSTEAVVLEHLHVKPEAAHAPASPHPVASQADTPVAPGSGGTNILRASSGRPPLPRPPPSASTTPALQPQQSGPVLVKSPIVQVPIPDGDGPVALTTSPTEPRSVPRGLLIPSPDLVVLAPGGNSEPVSPTIVDVTMLDAATVKPSDHAAEVLVVDAAVPAAGTPAKDSPADISMQALAPKAAQGHNTAEATVILKPTLCVPSPPPLAPEDSIPQGSSLPSPIPLLSPSPPPLPAPPQPTADAPSADGSLAAAAAAVVKAVRPVPRPPPLAAQDSVHFGLGPASPTHAASPVPSPATEPLSSPLTGGPSPLLWEQHATPPPPPAAPSPPPPAAGQADAFTPVREIPLRTFFSAADVRRSLQEQDERRGSQSPQEEVSEELMSPPGAADSLPVVEQLQMVTPEIQAAVSPSKCSPPESAAGEITVRSTPQRVADGDHQRVADGDHHHEADASEPRAAAVDLIASTAPVAPSSPPSDAIAAEAHALAGALLGQALSLVIDSPNTSAGGASSSQHPSPDVRLPPPPPDSLARAALLAAASRAATPRDLEVLQQAGRHPTEEESFASDAGSNSPVADEASSAAHAASGPVPQGQVNSAAIRQQQLEGSLPATSFASVVDLLAESLEGDGKGVKADGPSTAASATVASAPSTPRPSPAAEPASPRAAAVELPPTPVGSPHSRTPPRSAAAAESVGASAVGSPDGAAHATPAAPAVKHWTYVDTGAVGGTPTSAEIAAWDSGGPESGSDVLEISSESDSDLGHIAALQLQAQAQTAQQAPAAPPAAAGTVELPQLQDPAAQALSLVEPIACSRSVGPVQGQSLVASATRGRSMGSAQSQSLLAATTRSRSVGSAQNPAVSVTRSRSVGSADVAGPQRRASGLRSSAPSSQAGTPTSRQRPARASQSVVPAAFGSSSPSRMPPPRTASGSYLAAARRLSTSSAAGTPTRHVERPAPKAATPKAPASPAVSTAASSPGLRASRDGGLSYARAYASPATKARAPLPPSAGTPKATPTPARRPAAGRASTVREPSEPLSVAARTLSRTSRASSEGAPRGPASGSSSRIPVKPTNSAGAASAASQRRPVSSRIPGPPQLSREASTISSLNFDSDNASVRESADSVHLPGHARRGAVPPAARGRAIFYPHDTEIRGVDQTQSLRLSSEDSVVSELTSPTCSRASGQIPFPPVHSDGATPQQRSSTGSRIPSLTRSRQSIVPAEGELAEGAPEQAGAAAGPSTEGEVATTLSSWQEEPALQEGARDSSQSCAAGAPAEAPAAVAVAATTNATVCAAPEAAALVNTPVACLSPSLPNLATPQAQSVTPGASSSHVGSGSVRRIPPPPQSAATAAITPTSNLRSSGIPMAPHAASPITPATGCASVQQQSTSAAGSRGSISQKQAGRRRPSPFTSLPSPRVDAAGPGSGTPDFLADGHVSSPVARMAGSYTAAYLMKTGPTPPSGSSSGRRRGSLLPQVGAGGASNRPTVPRGVKLHNPLFIGNSPRLANVNYHDEEHQSAREAAEAGEGSSGESAVAGHDLPTDAVQLGELQGNGVGPTLA